MSSIFTFKKSTPVKFDGFDSPLPPILLSKSLQCHSFKCASNIAGGSRSSEAKNFNWTNFYLSCYDDGNANGNGNGNGNDNDDDDKNEEWTSVSSDQCIGWEIKIYPAEPSPATETGAVRSDLYRMSSS